MEDLGVKAVIIGTGIFVTILIVSLFFVSFNQMKEIFSLVQATDNSIHSQFNNYQDKYISAYHEKTMMGIDIINALRIAEQEPDLKITVTYINSDSIRRKANDEGMRESEYLKMLMDEEEKISGKRYKYNDEYSVRVIENTSGIEIKFTEKN